MHGNSLGIAADDKDGPKTGSATALVLTSERGGFREPVQLAAAKAVIEAGSRLRESVELDERLSALEARGKGR